MAFLELNGLSRAFGSVPAVERVTLSIAAGEFFTLLGPSGCGKTTLLRLVAGLESPDEGEVLLDGKSLNGVPPEDRPLHTVFQSYALFPHLSVAENVAFPLKMRRTPAVELASRVEEALSRVRLEGLGGRRPHELSGGQRQRVALARALVGRPTLLLLDEPLAALDLKLREEMQRELVALQRDVGITFLYVTHDQGEALALSDRIAVFDRGRVVQVGEPSAVYSDPANRFVAGFLGSCNLLPATVEGVRGEELLLEVEGLGAVTARAGAPLPGRRRGTLALRPERVGVEPAGSLAAETNRFCGVVEDRVFLGGTTVYRVRTAGGALVEASVPSASGATRPGPGETVELSWNEDAVRFLDE